MNRIRQGLRFAYRQLRLECTSIRVIMGYLFGLAIMMYFLQSIIQYVADTGQPVNVLEAFILVEHQVESILFLVPGWLLVLADAPFVKGNTYYSLYRSRRSSWNIGMIGYLLLQGLCYTAVLITFSVMVTSMHGFIGPMWSNPIYELMLDNGNLATEYGLVFPCLNMMKQMNVYTALLLTAVCFYLYLIFIGLLFYGSSLCFHYGMVIPSAILILGYLTSGTKWFGAMMMKWAVPGNLIDNQGMDVENIGYMVLVIAVFIIITFPLEKRADLQTKEEKE